MGLETRLFQDSNLSNLEFMYYFDAQLDLVQERYMNIQKKKETDNFSYVNKSDVFDLLLRLQIVLSSSFFCIYFENIQLLPKLVPKLVGMLVESGTSQGTNCPFRKCTEKTRPNGNPD